MVKAPTLTMASRNLRYWDLGSMSKEASDDTNEVDGEKEDEGAGTLEKLQCRCKLSRKDFVAIATTITINDK